MMLGFAFVCLLLPSFGLSGRTNLTIDIEDMEIERQLKLLNKPAIKTIVEDNGDIFDCVDINKQLAFDHPSLKDHKIQLRPSSFPDELFDEISSLTNSTSIEIGLKDGGCPLGTVPIRRVSKEDLIRMRSSLKHKKMMMHSPTNPQSGHGRHKWAVHRTRQNPKDPDHFQYYGASAFLNIYALPRLQDTQFSTGLIWLVNDLSSNQVNQITAGWTVSPTTYGDSQTRLSTGWTVDSFTNTGCHDERCPGFVHVSKRIALGTTFTHLSTYNGPQYGIFLVIYRDPITLNWWLIYGREKEPIGYWPTKLFTNLANHANRVDFGGAAGNADGFDMPPMGNGHFPNEGYRKTGFFELLKFIDSNVKSRNVLHEDVFPLYPTSQCYNLGNINETGGDQGTLFLYGGPGGSRC
ncbi:hypothetical protein J5N97_027817 [Dioscorea zingiberensis]|uniref:Neprosin PEP catalytic domain-containing protein n=1 Tax=Dioscorea zingiberensis TaxID=325984 RepID=A0A9D5BY07_9LILI|nr:hypothetical protein J5N97_027817 [Dioscorea zingiberensis]